MKITGKHIYLKPITVNDSKFIFNLRKIKKISLYLNNPPKKLSDQIVWVKKNITNEKTLDFLICDKNNNKKIGTIGFNDINKSNSIAEWGRWICTGTTLQNIESAITLLDYGFNKLKFKRIYSLTNSKNRKVLNFHKRSKAKFKREIKNKYIILGKSVSAISYEFDKKRFLAFKKRFNFMIGLTR